MNCLKNIGVSCIFSISLILILTFILTIFNYINFINDGFLIFFEVFNLVISIFVGGFFVGKKSYKKGWLEGIKFGFIFTVLMVLINYLGFDVNISVKFIIFNIIILVVAMFGGMVGISFRKEKK